MFPQQAKTVYGEIDTSSSMVSKLVVNGNLIDGNTFTVLYARISSEDVNATNRLILGCGSSASDANTTSLLTFNGRSFNASSSPYKQAETWGKIVCDENLYLFSTVNTTNEYQYQVTYVPYDSNTVDLDPKDEAFALLIIIVLLFVWTIAMIYNKIFKKIHDSSII